MKTKKKPKVFGLANYNGQYFIDLKYDYEQNCHEYGCESEGICRCSNIVNERIVDENIDCVYLVKEYKKLKPTEFEKYCINRILTCHKVYNPDNWCINICGGYYGQEIDSVEFNAALQVDNDVQNMLKLKTNRDKLFFVLNLEYGYILPELQDKKLWRIKTVSKSNVIIGQKDYSKKLDIETVKIYEDFPFARGVCLPLEKGKYRLIDGFHRFAACKSDKIMIIC